MEDIHNYAKIQVRLCNGASISVRTLQRLISQFARLLVLNKRVIPYCDTVNISNSIRQRQRTPHMFSQTSNADDILQLVNGTDEFDTTTLDVDSNSMEQESTTPDVEPSDTELAVEVKELPVDLPIDDDTEELKSKSSIRSTDPSYLRNILKDVTNTHSASTQIDVDTVTAYLQRNYTGKARFDLILDFMLHRLEFCSEDKVKSLQRFGEPLNKDMAEAFTQYLAEEGYLTSSELYNKKWGKPFSTIFKHVAKSVWPNSHKRSTFKDIAKDRHLYGIRMKAGGERRRCHTATKSTDDTPTKRTKRNTDGQRDVFATPSPSSSEHSQVPRIYTKRREREVTHEHKNRTPIKRRKHGGFTPHYDILHNDYKYVVRVFLPLMKQRTAQLLQVKVNLALRTLKIMGNYFPGHLVGSKASQEIKLKQPLIPIIYAPQSFHGNFEILVRLPSDIKDSMSTIQSIHDCWGLTYVFPRRKITRETTIDLTSCFGNARLTTMNSNKSTRRSTESKDTTQPQINMNTSSRPTEQPEKNAEDWKFTADRNCLIGLPITIPGERWSKLFKGHEYTGFITSCELNDKDGYYYFTVFFEDCEEKFCLDELLKEKFITTEVYDLLKPQCNPMQPNESMDQTISD